MKWLRNLASRFKPKRVSELEQELMEAREAAEYFRSLAAGLEKSVVHLNNKEQLTRTNSTIIIGALVASQGGKILLDGNIIDAIASNKRLSVRIDEAEQDGSRTIRLIERSDDDADEREPTDEELYAIERELEEDYEEDDDDILDDDDDECDCDRGY